MMDENIINPDKKNDKDIICYNCLRTIDISGLEEGTFFKCRKCFTTLVVADYFRVLRKKIQESRNRWGVIGIILGLSPMILIIGMVTVYPVLFVSLFILMTMVILFSLQYFKKRANDILLGIIFAELGVYANISSIVLNNFTAAPYNTNVPDISLQIYFFLIAGSLLIFFGLKRRAKFLLK